MNADKSTTSGTCACDVQCLHAVTNVKTGNIDLFFKNSTSGNVQTVTNFNPDDENGRDTLRRFFNNDQTLAMELGLFK